MLGARGGQVNESDSPADLHRRANLQPAPLGALPDLLDGGRDNRRSIFGVVKLKVHPSTDEAPLQHGTFPGRACNDDQDWLGTVPGVS